MSFVAADYVSYPWMIIHIMYRLGRELYRRCNMKIIPVPVREDNYAYILIDQPSNEAAIVDPFDVPKVASVAASLGVSVVAGITTHHHFDHSGGNKVLILYIALKVINLLASGLRVSTLYSTVKALNTDVSQAAKFPGIPIYGGSDKIPALTKLVKDKDEFVLGKNTSIRYLLLKLNLHILISESQMSGNPVSHTGFHLLLCDRHYR